MSKCASCIKDFLWNDTVVIVEGEIYPTAYFAMLDGEVLGETENEDGQMAYEVVDSLEID